MAVVATMMAMENLIESKLVKLMPKNVSPKANNPEDVNLARLHDPRCAEPRGAEPEHRVLKAGSEGAFEETALYNWILLGMPCKF